MKKHRGNKVSDLLFLLVILLILSISAALNPRSMSAQAGSVPVSRSSQLGLRWARSRPAPAGIFPPLLGASTMLRTPQGGGYPLNNQMDMVGQYGGYMQAVAVSGHYAFVGVGSSLAVLNVVDPSHPTEIGRSTPLPGLIDGIAVVGNYGYVADDQGGLRVLDLTDLTRPREVGAYPYIDNCSSFNPVLALGVTMIGSAAYVESQCSITVLDVTQPAAPSLIRTLSYHVTGLTTVGNYAYFTHWIYNPQNQSYDFWLRVLDVTQPTNPQETAALDLAASECGEPAAANGYVYAMCNGGMLVISVASPSQPRVVATIPISGTWYNLQSSLLVIAANRLYVVQGYSGAILDISAPSAPRVMTAFVLSGYYAYGLAVKDSYLYVADWDVGLVVYLVAQDQAHWAGGYKQLAWAADITVAGRYAYVADHWHATLSVIDISTPASPRQIGLCPVGGGPLHLALAWPYVYVVGGSDLSVVDVHDPAHPAKVGSYPARYGISSVRGVATDGRYVYTTQTSTTSMSLVALDVANPSQPVEVGMVTWPVNWIPWGVNLAVKNHIIYLANNYLYVIDATIPSAPRAIRQLSLPSGSAENVAVAGDYAYVSSGAGLYRLSLADPASPIIDAQAGQFANAGTGQHGFAYVAGGGVLSSNPGVRVFDLLTPGAPATVGYYVTPAYSSALALQEDYIYVADGVGGLSIYQPRRTVMAQIGTGGGTLNAFFDRVTYTFPVGGFTQAAQVTHRPYAGEQIPIPRDLGQVGRIFEVRALDSAGRTVQPAAAYTLAVRYADDEVSGIIGSSLTLYHWDGNGWQAEPSSTLNTNTHTVSASVGELGIFAVLGETERTYLPLCAR